MFGPKKPATCILERIIRAREIRSMTQAEVSAHINASPLYGEYTHGSYRNLEVTDFEDETAPRTALNVLLVIAIADALSVPVSELATDSELATLRDKPYRRAQWPESMRIEAPQGRTYKSRGTVVPSPTATARRIAAYAKQNAYTATDLAAVIQKRTGYRIGVRRLAEILNPNTASDILGRLVTYELCNAIARTLNRPFSKFELEWLLNCKDTCPHCTTWLINA